MKTLAEQLDAVLRELAMRRNAYPRWVRDGKMTQAKADHEIACMEAVAATVQKAKTLKEVGDDMMKGTKCN